MSEQDTREQLEADIREWTECSWVTVQHEKVIDWLDRQAEITEHAMAKAYEEQAAQLVNDMNTARAERDKWKATYLEKRDIAEYWHHKYVLLQDRRDELIAECSELKKRNEQLGYSNKLVGKSEARKIEYIDQLVEYIDKLEAECDQLQKVVHIQAESFRKLERELKEAKDGIRGSHADDKPGDEKAEG